MSRGIVIFPFDASIYSAERRVIRLPFEKGWGGKKKEKRVEGATRADLTDAESVPTRLAGFRGRKLFPVF